MSRTRLKQCPDCAATFEAETASEKYCEDCANAFNDDADVEMLGDDAGMLEDVGAK